MAFPCTDDPHHRTHLALADVDGHLGHPDGCFRHVVPVNPPGPSHGEKLRSLLRSDPGRRCPGLPVHPESERRHRRSLYEVRHRVCCPQRQRRRSASCDGSTSGLGTRWAGRRLGLDNSREEAVGPVMAVTAGRGRCRNTHEDLRQRAVQRSMAQRRKSRHNQRRGNGADRKIVNRD